MGQSARQPGERRPAADTPLDAWIMARIDYRALRLAARLGLDEQRTQDVRQELVLALLASLSRFDPAKSTWRTFACQVLDRRAKQLLRDEMARRSREAGRPVGLALRRDGSAPHTGNARHEDVEAVDLRLDVEQVLSEMPERLRAVCALLASHTPTEAARLAGIPRTSLYRLIEQARPYFRRAGYGPEDFCATDRRGAGDIEGNSPSQETDRE